MRRDYIQELEELVEHNLETNPHYYDDPNIPIPKVTLSNISFTAMPYTSIPYITPSGYVVTDTVSALLCPGCHHSADDHNLLKCKKCNGFCGYLVAT